MSISDKNITKYLMGRWLLLLLLMVQLPTIAAVSEYKTSKKYDYVIVHTDDGECMYSLTK